ncbi:MAG: hypothetical protein R3E96_04810 [Planctomycetota bacterium]
MRGPIQFALFSPERLENPALVGFDWETFSTLTFEPPDREAFPALDLGFGVHPRRRDLGCGAQCGR